MSPFRTGRILHMREVLQSHVQAGRARGIATLLHRRGDTMSHAFGDVARDTIFRVSSMSKPITAAAVMLLVEDCVLRLEDPIDALLPELANRKVLRTAASELDDVVPAKRPITLRDLLTFTWGFGMIGGPNDRSPIRRATDERELCCLGPPLPATPLGPDAWLARLSELPLMAQPGEKWLYHTGAMVLSVLVARASGKPFEQFLHERIFEPLDMVDTGFSVPQGKRDRLRASEWGDGSTFDPVDGHWSRPPAFPDGGAGLVSTLDDFLAFGRMMLGETHLLSRRSIELMTTDQLTPQQKSVSGFMPGFFDDCGWGFGVCVTTRRDHLWATPGRFGWDGGLGTSFWCDPAENLVGILMTQRAGFPPLSPIYKDFWTSAYAALT